VVKVLAFAISENDVRKKLLELITARYGVATETQVAAIASVRPITRQWSTRRALKTARKSHDSDVAAAASKALDA